MLNTWFVSPGMASSVVGQFKSNYKCSEKQINCDCSIEFLSLCQNFKLTPTFARVDKDKTPKWKNSSKSYCKIVFAEEFRAKIKQSETLKCDCEINSIYTNIRQACSLFRYTCILRTINGLRKDYYQQVMSVHTRKISRLLTDIEIDVDEHISSHELSFFQKLVFCRGLKFAIP